MIKLIVVVKTRQVLYNNIGNELTNREKEAAAREEVGVLTKENTGNVIVLNLFKCLKYL